jgi:thiol-disulfide isomerase/thioredoxin
MAQMAKPAAPTQPFAFNVRAPALVSEPFDWINTDGKKLEFRRGQVYVVEFWAFGCINCLRNLPAYARWQKKFEGKSVTLIGVHSPETDAERQREKVVRQIEKLGITYPVLLDQQMINWKSWQQQVWPTVYLVDKIGRARFRWVGELAWMGAKGEELMAARIEQLLREP